MVLGVLFVFSVGWSVLEAWSTLEFVSSKSGLFWSVARFLFATETGSAVLVIVFAALFTFSLLFQFERVAPTQENASDRIEASFPPGPTLEIKEGVKRLEELRKQATEVQASINAVSERDHIQRAYAEIATEKRIREEADRNRINALNAKIKTAFEENSKLNERLSQQAAELARVDQKLIKTREELERFKTPQLTMSLKKESVAALKDWRDFKPGRNQNETILTLLVMSKVLIPNLTVEVATSENGSSVRLRAKGDTEPYRPSYRLAAGESMEFLLAAFNSDTGQAVLYTGETTSPVQSLPQAEFRIIAGGSNTMELIKIGRFKYPRQMHDGSYADQFIVDFRNAE